MPNDSPSNRPALMLGTDWLWIGLVLMLAMAVAALMPIVGADYWYYLRVGGDVIATRAVPTVDTYSWSQLGQPYIYYSWLSAVILSAANSLGGPALTVALRVLIVALMFGVLWLGCKDNGASPRLSALVVLIAAAASSNNLAIRPQLLIYPLFALTLLILSRWRRGDARWVWALIPMAVLWVNLHASFVLMFLLAGAAMITGGSDRKRLAIALAVSVAALIINPRGLGFLDAVGNLLSSPSVFRFAAEWQPPDVNVWQTAVFFVWLIAFPVLAALSSNKPRWAEWLWFAGLGWLSLHQARSVIWWVLAVTPMTASLLTPLVSRFTDRASSRGIPVMNAALLAVMLALPFALLPGLRDAWWPQSPPAFEPSTPVKAVSWLDDHPDLSGPLWADAVYGSYLIYALPERPVWIDPRVDLYPPNQWEDYFATANGVWDWQHRLNATGANLLMLSRGGQPELIAAVQQSDKWNEAYSDDLTIIFERR